MATVEQLLETWRGLDAAACEAEEAVRRLFEQQLDGGAGPGPQLIREASALRHEATAAFNRLSDAVPRRQR